MNKEILLFGIGPLAKTVLSLIKEIDSICVKGFVVDDEYFIDKEFLGFSVFKLSEVPIENKIVVCIGYKNMRMRKEVYDKLKNKGFRFENIIHPTVYISENTIMGDNNIIFPNVCIEPNVKIGNNNIIWSQTLIGHDAIVYNHNYISAKVLIGGNSKVYDNSFLGNAVSTINDLIIETETYLVAGSFLFNNTQKFTKYFGNPARKIDTHQNSGILI